MDNCRYLHILLLFKKKKNQLETLLETETLILNLYLCKANIKLKKIIIRVYYILSRSHLRVQHVC